MRWHEMDHKQTICTSLQTDDHTNTSSLNFYRPDARFNSGMKERVGDGKLIIIISITVSGINDRKRFYN